MDKLTLPSDRLARWQTWDRPSIVAIVAQYAYRHLPPIRVQTLSAKAPAAGWGAFVIRECVSGLESFSSSSFFHPLSTGGNTLH